MSFLATARQGNSSGWLYLLGFFLIVFFGWVGIFITAVLASLCHSLVLDRPITLLQLADQHLAACWEKNAIAAYAISHIPFLVLGVGLILVMKGLHQRRFLSLVNAEASIRWQRFFAGFALWFLLLSIQAGSECWLAPQRFLVTTELSQWLLLLPLALIITPIQAAVEELLFRGYLLQGLSLLTRRPLVLVLAVSLPFALGHQMNLEMQRGAIWMTLLYFAVSAFLTAITLKDDRLELALGIHAANNLFGVLIVRPIDSALPTSALLIQHTPASAQITLVLFLVFATLTYYCCFRKTQNLLS